MIIRDLRDNEEAKKERDTQEEAYKLTGYIQLVCDAARKPGEWIKRYGSHFKHLKDLRARHFQDPLGYLMGKPQNDPLEKEKEKYKNIPYGR